MPEEVYVATHRNFEGLLGSQLNTGFVKDDVRIAGPMTTSRITSSNFTESAGASGFLGVNDSEDVSMFSSVSTHGYALTRTGFTSVADAIIRSELMKQTEAIGLYGRFTDQDNFYRVIQTQAASVQKLRLEKRTTGVVVTLAEVNITPENDMDFELEISGTSLTGRAVDLDVSVSSTDSDHASGRWGLFASRTVQPITHSYAHTFQEVDDANAMGTFETVFDRGASAPEAERLYVAIGSVTRGDGFASMMTIEHSDDDVSYTTIAEGIPDLARLFGSLVLKRYVRVTVDLSRSTLDEDNNPGVESVILVVDPDQGAVPASGGGGWFE